MTPPSPSQLYRMAKSAAPSPAQPYIATRNAINFHLLIAQVPSDKVTSFPLTCSPSSPTFPAPSLASASTFAARVSGRARARARASSKLQAFLPGSKQARATACSPSYHRDTDLQPLSRLVCFVLLPNMALKSVRNLTLHPSIPPSIPSRPIPSHPISSHTDTDTLILRSTAYCPTTDFPMPIPREQPSYTDADGHLPRCRLPVPVGCSAESRLPVLPRRRHACNSQGSASVCVF